MDEQSRDEAYGKLVETLEAAKSRGAEVCMYAYTHRKESISYLSVHVHTYKNKKVDDALLDGLRQAKDAGQEVSADILDGLRSLTGMYVCIYSLFTTNTTATLLSQPNCYTHNSHTCLVYVPSAGRIRGLVNREQAMAFAHTLDGVDPKGAIMDVLQSAKESGAEVCMYIYWIYLLPSLMYTQMDR